MGSPRLNSTTRRCHATFAELTLEIVTQSDTGSGSALSYVHSQTLTFVVPSGLAWYSCTPALPLSDANFSESVWK